MTTEPDISPAADAALTTIHNHVEDLGIVISTIRRMIADDPALDEAIRASRWRLTWASMELDGISDWLDEYRMYSTPEEATAARNRYNEYVEAHNAKLADSMLKGVPTDD